MPESRQPGISDTHKRLLFTLVFLGIFVAAGSRLLLDPRFLAVGEDLRRTSPMWIPVIAGLYLLAGFVTGMLMRVVLNRLGYPITHGQAFCVFVVRMYANLLVSKAGIATAAALMKLRYRVSIADFGSMLIAITVLQFVCIGIAGLVAQLILRLFFAIPVNPVIFAIFAGCLAGSTATIFVRIPVPWFLPARIAGFLKHLDAGWYNVTRGRRDTALVIHLLSLQFLIIVLRAVRLWIAFSALGIAVTPLGLFVASLLGDLGLLIGITPMGLGFRETAIAYGARLAGTSAEAAVAVTLADRAIWSVAVLLVAQIILMLIFRQRSGVKKEPEGNVPGEPVCRK